MSELVRTVAIQLDRERNMRLTLADAREFRKLTQTEARPDGISLLRGDLARASLGEDEWIALFFCMLRHEDPELTEDHVAEVMDMGSFVRAGEAFEELFSTFRGKGSGPTPADPTESATEPT